jgi:hypothetical protein
MDCNFTRNENALGNGAFLELLNEQPQDTIIRLKQCTFQDNKVDIRLRMDEGTDAQPGSLAFVYSDITLNITHIAVNNVSSSLPLSQAPADRNGINGESEWLEMVKQVCSSTTLVLHHSRFTLTSWHACSCAEASDVCMAVQENDSRFKRVWHLLPAACCCMNSTGCQLHCEAQLFQVPAHSHQQTFKFDFKGRGASCDCPGLLVQSIYTMRHVCHR